MTRWRIYYGDGYSFDDGDAFHAPAPGGVQVIAQERPGRERPHLIHSKDAYYFRDGRWFICDESKGLG